LLQYLYAEPDNVSGLHAVEIELKNGKKYRIGTDVPENPKKNYKVIYLRRTLISL